MKNGNLVELFELSDDFHIDNSLRTRLLCCIDFFKHCALFPWVLLFRLWKLFFRAMGVGSVACFIGLSLGISGACRGLFVERMVLFAKEMADLVLLPLGLIGSLSRLFLAFFIHPKFYTAVRRIRK